MAVHESVLVIDDVDGDAAHLCALLAGEGRDVHRAASLAEAARMLHDTRVDLVCVSLELASMPGPRVVRWLREEHPSSPVVALTASPDPQAAVATIRSGGADYLGKPVDPARLDEAVRRALQEVRADRALRETQELVADRYGFQDMLSRSRRMHEVFDQIRAVARTDATVLVQGETGTGKELVARAIHNGSKRKERPYVSVNCGAFAEGLLESELFGHEVGAFTGASARREGVFELADGGTLFLDELAETSLGTQVNLLRVLEEMSFRRVGGETPVNVDVRIIAATHEDLEEAVRGGRFRQDLYYRLDVFPIRIPPLRERREDIPILLRHFLDGAAREYGLPAPRISADAMHWIVHHDWPGNVRQLRAMCERWVIVAQGRTLLVEMLPSAITSPAAAASAPNGIVVDEDAPMAPQLDRLGAQFEKAYLHQVLTKHGGHLQRTADHAGISRRTLYTKMQAFGLDAASYRRSR